MEADYQIIRCIFELNPITVTLLIKHWIKSKNVDGRYLKTFYLDFSALSKRSHWRWKWSDPTLIEYLYLLCSMTYSYLEKGQKKFKHVWNVLLLLHSNHATIKLKICKIITNIINDMAEVNCPMHLELMSYTTNAIQFLSSATYFTGFWTFLTL